MQKWKKKGGANLKETSKTRGLRGKTIEMSRNTEEPKERKTRTNINVLKGAEGEKRKRTQGGKTWSDSL